MITTAFYPTTRGNPSTEGTPSVLTTGIDATTTDDLFTRHPESTIRSIIPKGTTSAIVPVTEDVNTLGTTTSIDDKAREKVVIAQALVESGVYESPPVVFCPDLDWVSLQDPTRHIEVSGHMAGDQVVVSCQLGYKFPSRDTMRSVICLESGTWSSTIPTCSAVGCSFTVEPGGHVHRVKYLDTATISCPPGKVTPTGKTRQTLQCSSDGYFHKEIEECVDGPRCAEFPYIGHADQTLEEVTGGGVQVALVRCHSSYRFIDGSKMRRVNCTSSGDWDIAPSLRCMEKNCSPLPALLDSNTQVNSTSSAADTVVQVTCAPGTTLLDGSSSRVSRCKDGIEWVPALEDVCQDAQCPDDALHDVTIVGPYSAAVYGAVLELRCEGEDRFLDGTRHKMVACGLNGQWNSTLSDCQAGRCPPVPRIDDTSYDGSNTSEGVTVVYRCDVGHATPEGDTALYVTCSDGTWRGSGLTGACHFITCPVPHSLFYNASTQNGTYLYNDVIRSTCPPGYVFSDGTSVTESRCEVGGRWSATKNCSVIMCPQLDLPPRSVQEPVDQRYNTSVTVTCLKQNWFTRLKVPSLVITCTETGRWSSDIPKCQPIQCPLLTVLEGILPDHLNISSDTAVNYTCGDGFSFLDPPGWRLSTCTTDGEWDPPIEGCSVGAMKEEDPAEAELAIPFAVPILTLAAGMVILLIVSDVPLLVLHIGTGCTCCKD